MLASRDGEADSGVDHGNGVPPDDDAEIGDVACIVGRRQSDLAEMAEVALSDGAIVYNPKPVTDAADVLSVLRAAY